MGFSYAICESIHTWCCKQDKDKFPGEVDKFCNQAELKVKGLLVKKDLLKSNLQAQFKKFAFDPAGDGGGGGGGGDEDEVCFVPLFQRCPRLSLVLVLFVL